MAFPSARGTYVADGIKLIIDPRRRWIDWNLVTRGSYESGTVSLINHLLDSGGTFVDIGANIGLLSVYAAKRTGNDGLVFAFEPDPENFSRLVWARDANNVPWLHPIPLAVGAAPEQALLWRAPSGDGGLSSLVPIGGFESAGSVPVTSLDTFFRSIHPGRVDLVKIDAEGFENEIVRGALEFLHRHKPSMIIEMTSSGAVEAGKLLIEQGFKSYVSEGKSVPDASRLIRRAPQILQWDNMVFIHADNPHCLKSGGLEIQE